MPLFWPYRASWALFVTWPALFKICRLRTREEAKQIYDAGMLFLRQHVELSKIAQSRRLLIWVLKPKVHAVISTCFGFMLCGQPR